MRNTELCLSRRATASLLLALCCFALLRCSSPLSLKPTVKIGLSAPFEGFYRDLGYEVLHAAQLAVRQRNASGGIDQRYLVELVALNDFNEAGEAILQAREMYVDPGVLGVLGGWSFRTAQAAAPEYKRLGLAFLAPEMDMSSAQPSGPVDSTFAANYQEFSGGAPPGPAAVWAYSNTNRLLDAMAVAAAEGRLTRASVRAALNSSP
jgi:hypothetical protein